MSREAQMSLQLQCSGLVENTTPKASATVGESVPLLQLLTGIGEDQINRAISKEDIELAEDAFIEIDLYDFAGFDCGAGDGLDGCGQSNAWDQLVGLMVIVDAGSAGELRVGGQATGAAFNSPWDGDDSARNIIKSSAELPGVLLILNPAADAYEITDATNHLLKFHAIGGSVTFSVHVWGRDV